MVNGEEMDWMCPTEWRLNENLHGRHVSVNDRCSCWHWLISVQLRLTSAGITSSHTTRRSNVYPPTPKQCNMEGKLMVIWHTMIRQAHHYWTPLHRGDDRQYQPSMSRALPLTSPITAPISRRHLLHSLVCSAVWFAAGLCNCCSYSITHVVIDIHHKNFIVWLILSVCQGQYTLLRRDCSLPG